MNRKIAVLLLAALLLLLAAGCGNTEAALSSVEVAMQEETRTVGENTIQLSYPTVSAADDSKGAAEVVARINEQLNEHAERFVQQVETQYEGQSGTFGYTAEVQYNQDGQLSVVERQTMGDDYLQYAATYDLGSGEKMSLGQVLDMEQDEAEKLVIQQISGVTQSDPTTFHADAVAYVQEQIDQLQYYRCNEGLAVFFQAGEIAPTSVGIAEIVIQ